jgi:hypothetical protein
MTAKDLKPKLKGKVVHSLNTPSSFKFIGEIIALPFV